MPKDIKKNINTASSTDSLNIETQPIDIPDHPPFKVDTPSQDNERESFTLRHTKSFINRFLKKAISSNPEWVFNPNFNKNYFAHNSEIKFNNLYLQTSNKNIIGVHLYSPSLINNDTKFCILIHGMSMNRKEFIKRFPIESVVQSNVVVMVPDLTSFGDSKGEYDIKNINFDVERCVNYLISVYNLDLDTNLNSNKIKNKINLIGHCIGSGIILEFYNYINNGLLSIYINKMVLISPCTNEFDLFKDKIRFKLVKNYVDRNEIILSCRKYIHDNIENIRNVDKDKIIIFHGNKDLVVPFDHGLKLANEIGCKIFRSENDGYWCILNNREVIGKILEFIESG